MAGRDSSRPVVELLPPVETDRGTSQEDDVFQLEFSSESLVPTPQPPDRFDEQLADFFLLRGVADVLDLCNG